MSHFSFFDFFLFSRVFFWDFLGALDGQQLLVVEGSGVALTPGVNLPGVGPPGVGVSAQALVHKISVKNTAARTHMLWTYTR